MHTCGMTRSYKSEVRSNKKAGLRHGTSSFGLHRVRTGQAVQLHHQLTGDACIHSALQGFAFDV